MWSLVSAGAVMIVLQVYYISKLYKETDHFDLKKIIVKNNSMLSAGEVIELSKVKRGVRLMDIDTRSIVKRLNDSPYIDNSKIRLVYPAAIVIEVNESEPIAYINVNNELMYVNNEGDVLNRSKPGAGYDLPIIASSADKDIIGFLNLTLETSPFIYHQISEIEKTNLGIELYLTHSSSNVVIGKEDFEKKIVVLENFLKEEYGSISFKNVEYIDLRFDRQVVLKEFASAGK
jgi:cell division septal protein FtsQ